MPDITQQAREAAAEIEREIGIELFPGTREAIAAIIAQRTRAGELREALKKVCDSDWPSHLKAISEASALLAALDAEEGGKPNE